MPLPLLQRIESFEQSVAIMADGKAYTYAQLVQASAQVASALLANRNDLDEARIAFLVPPSFDYAATMCGIWQAGGVAVPLAVQHPPAEWEYYIDNAAASALVIHADYAEKIQPLASARSLPVIPSVICRQASSHFAMPSIDDSRRAMILYTSGTTNRPKGVVSTHANLEAQIVSLIEAWGWIASDHILHVLPLHHVHGIVNALLCALWSGATCEFLPRFDARRVWERLSGGDVTLFMAVPTIYAKLIAAWEQASPEERRTWSAGASKLRLMVSGSAALPVATLKKWQSITGHVLLERYGMTEIGMALSNPLHDERLPGHVGLPLPGVEVRLVDETGHTVSAGTPGEIEVRGPNVFLEYWRNPAATAVAFRDGWFRTGDLAVLENGSYRILGRTSVDIIKTGGYKVSALEVEDVLLTHPAIRECAVVGLPDPEWGELVCACAVLNNSQSLDIDELRRWAKERLAGYKVPRLLRTVSQLPRNAMGKVQKHQVATLLANERRS